MKPTNLWEEVFFKKRSIINYFTTTPPNESVLCKPMTDVDVDVDELLTNVDDRLYHYLTIRRGRPEWIFFSLWEGQSLQGYSFLHAPEKEEWNDSLPTLPGEARISSNFVYPDHRGKGIRGEIFSKQCSYAEKNGLKLWAVVEDSNTPSIRAEKKNGFIAKKNYLIKLFGINLLSISTNPFNFYFLRGARRVRR